MMTSDPTVRELALRVLLAEKQYLDGRITAVLDLQTKINAFLVPAVALAAGWVIANPIGTAPNPALRPIGLLVIVIVLCAVNLQTVINTLIGIGNIHQKTVVLEQRLRAVLELPDQPLVTFDGWATKPIRSSLALATAVLSLLQTALCILALRAASSSMAAVPELLPTVRIAWGLLGATILCQLVSARATAAVLGPHPQQQAPAAV
jgi:hypothetical protein